MSILHRPAIHVILVLLFAGVMLAPVRIPYRILWLAAAALVIVRVESGSVRPIGLARHPWRKTLAWGAALALFSAGLVGELLQPMIEGILGEPTDYSGYGALAGNLPAALRLLGFALLSAAIGEEIVARGFLLHQLSALTGESRVAKIAGILIAAAIFGLAHAKQGTSGVIATAIIGAAASWVWFRSGRNLPAVMLAHALTDSYGVAMLYAGRYG